MRSPCSLEKTAALTAAHRCKARVYCFFILSSFLARISFTQNKFCWYTVGNIFRGQEIVIRKRERGATTEGTFEILVRHVLTNEEKFKEYFRSTPVLFDYVFGFVNDNFSFVLFNIRHAEVLSLVINCHGGSCTPPPHKYALTPVLLKKPLDMQLYTKCCLRLKKKSIYFHIIHVCTYIM